MNSEQSSTMRAARAALGRHRQPSVAYFEDCESKLVPRWRRARRSVTNLSVRDLSDASGIVGADLNARPPPVGLHRRGLTNYAHR
jgi:hypothetical protein